VRSRYIDAEAAASSARTHFSSIPEIVAARTYTARLLGQEPSLVLHGGETPLQGCRKGRLRGILEVLYIKGRAAISRPSSLTGTLPVPRPAAQAAGAPRLTDEQMVNELRLALLTRAPPNPSVETLLHAWLPPASSTIRTPMPSWRSPISPMQARICAHVYGRGLVWVAYVMPASSWPTGAAMPSMRCSNAVRRPR